MKQFVVDAFTDRVFHGNQAAVCILDEWVTEELMQSITRENHFSETAFAVKEGDAYRLRWFTPGGEIDLCGHATLACAYVLLEHYLTGQTQVTFRTLSGELFVAKNGETLEMTFPAYTLKPAAITAQLAEALGAAPTEAYLGRDLLCIFEDEDTVRRLAPDMEKLMALDGLLLHASAPGRDVDCVSRSFAPKLQVPEDPVCGSGHCHIAPYWAKRLGKDALVAYQASERGGTLYCRVSADKVVLAGKAALFSAGELFV